MKKLTPLGLFLLTTLSGCIGTDYFDDKIVPEQIKLVSDPTLALLPNHQAQVLAEYYNEYGIKESVALGWQSSNSTVAEVDNNGTITANGTGQAIVEPYYKEFVGQEKIIVTVVSDPTAVATVEVINPSSTSLSTGAKIQLAATVRNVIGTELIGKAIEWFSENESILKVSSSGQVEAVGVGIAGVHAKVEGVKSNNIDFTVNGLVRTGTFVQAGGYKAVGTSRLEIINNELILTFSDNFDTDFALGTFIYLANSTNGSTVRASGLELGQIFTDGAKRFNISQINPNIGLNDYRYAIVLCKPASVTFGYADLK